MLTKWTLGLGTLLALSLACTQQISNSAISSEPPEPGGTIHESASPAGDFRSAARHDGETYEEAVTRHRKALALHAPERLGWRGTMVQDNQVAVSAASFANVPVWTDADIKAQFEYTRDLRFQTLTTNPTFLRRLTWLYPDDGCYSRAELVCVKAAEQGKTRPAKLFSFGSLTVASSNSPGGYVSWWYHVVPVVRSASTNEPMVLDAAIDPTKPLPWKDWLLKQVGSLDSVKVTVADTNAYDPSSPVTGAPNLSAQASLDQVNTFLQAEWDRQTELGRDPNKVLGANPPWLSTVDTKAPTVSLTAPSAGKVLVGTVALSATASDNVGVTKVDFYVGTKLVGFDTTSPFSITWDSRGVPNGSYAVTARAFDAAGNATTSTGVNVTVSNPTNTVYEVEPNNNRSAAQVLTLSGSVVQGTLGSNTDTDYFTCTVGAGKSLSATLTPNSSSDYDLFAYNSAGTLVASSKKAVGLVDAVSHANPGTSAAKYYVRVVYRSGLTGASGTYSLKIGF